ncbi:MAG: hypothetical protein VZR53_13485 [Prevotella sp.]|nr:hypothetical protein [Prevotella sp.]
MASIPILGSIGLIDKGIDQIINRSNSAYQNKETRNLMALQNEFNTLNYEKYGSPSAQMRQLKEAGLNPDLMYQNGASGIGNLGSVSMGSSAPVSPSSSGLTSSLATLTQLKLAEQQSKLNDANIGLVNANKDKAIAEANKLRSETPSPDFSDLITRFAAAHLENAPRVNGWVDALGNIVGTDSMSKPANAVAWSNGPDPNFKLSAADIDNVQKLISLNGDIYFNAWRKTYYDLQDKVAKTQLASDPVIKSLADMPYQQYKQTIESINKIKSDIDVNSSTIDKIAQDITESKSRVKNLDANTSYIKFKQLFEGDNNLNTIIRRLFDGWDTMDTQTKFMNFILALASLGMALK